MTNRTTITVSAGAARHVSRRDYLRQLLNERRRELVATLRVRFAGVGTAQSVMVGGRGLEGEEAEAIDLQAEVDRALTLIRAETLVQIDEALARLDTGRYGQCCLCGSQIPCSRLHVLPMASRCRDCDERQKAERMGSRFPQHHGRVIHIM